MNLENIINKLKINKGDKLLVTSNIIRIIINYKKKNITFDPNFLIDLLKEKIGKNGTLFFPTFNWDFCKGKTFNYYNTPSRTGSLGKIALKRHDFTRTANPIYSFAVTGKDKESICNLKHDNCYGLNSPFGYLIKKNGKNLFIDLKYKLPSGINSGGFIFHHVAEQQAKVDYRYFKKFKGFYIDKNKQKKLITIKYFVRDLNLKYSFFMKNSLDNEFLKKRILQKKIFKGIDFDLINIARAVKFLTNDLKRERKFFYKKIRQNL